jgi:hypothetical protein
MVWVLAGLVALLLGFVMAGAVVLWRDRRSSEVKVIERRPKAPEPIVIPAPDLTPYLDRIAGMATSMAKEIAQGVSLIVQGPPAPPGPATGQERGEAPGDNPEQDKDPVWYPPWETDQTWGIDSGLTEEGEWSAHTGTDAPMHDGTGTYMLDGTGAPTRSDGQPMFGGGGIWPPREAG